MEKITSELERLLTVGFQQISQFSDEELSDKSAPEKWSKKEILGHLIDSAINNLKRFTEIQFEPKPYKVIGYNQDELVKVNAYQESDPKELLSFWLSINTRIINIINIQTQETLNYEIENSNGEIKDLRFLIEDYVSHLSYHLDQIIN